MYKVNSTKNDNPIVQTYFQVDAKADPSLHWAHTEGHLVGFVVRQLIFLFWGVSSIQPSLALLLHKHIKIYFTCNCTQGMTMAQ